MFLLLVLILGFSISAFAVDTTYEAFSGVLKNPSDLDFLIGGKVNFGSGQKKNSLKIAAFEVSDILAVPYPAKYLLSYENNNLFFFPGVGFVTTDLELFLKRNRIERTFDLGGKLDAFASVLTTAVQVKLMRLPQGYVSQGFGVADRLAGSLASAMDEPLLLLVEMSEGYSSYLSLLYKLYPENAFRVSYLGNFKTNDINSIWVSWVKPDIGVGSLDIGLGVENGDQSFLPKGAYGLLSYSASISEYFALEGNLRLGSLQYGEDLIIDPSLATYLKLIFDDEVNELVFAAGLETYQKDPLANTPSFRFRLQYSHRDSFPLSVYLTKGDGKFYGLGVNYQF